MRWPSSTSPPAPTYGCEACPAASSDASTWPARCSGIRTSCCSTTDIIASLALPGLVVALTTSSLAVPVAVALGQDPPVNPLLYAVTVVVTLLLFVALACWTAAWTRNAEAAQLTSMPIIVLVVLGQVATAFPENVRRWIDLTPGAALTDLVRVSWFGLETGSTEQTLVLSDTWADAGAPVLSCSRTWTGNWSVRTPRCSAATPTSRSCTTRCCRRRG